MKKQILLISVETKPSKEKDHKTNWEIETSTFKTFDQAYQEMEREYEKEKEINNDQDENHNYLELTEARIGKNVNQMKYWHIGFMDENFWITEEFDFEKERS